MTGVGRRKFHQKFRSTTLDYVSYPNMKAGILSTPNASKKDLGTGQVTLGACTPRLYPKDISQNYF